MGFQRVHNTKEYTHNKKQCQCGQSETHGFLGCTFKNIGRIINDIDVCIILIMHMDFYWYRRRTWLQTQQDTELLSTSWWHSFAGPHEAAETDKFQEVSILDLQPMVVWINQLQLLDESNQKQQQPISMNWLTLLLFFPSTPTS